MNLGLVAKVSPRLVLSVPAELQDRALVTLVPHTTSTYGSRYEVTVEASFLHPGGVFDAQQVVTVPQAKLIRRLGDLRQDQFGLVEDAVRAWLGI